MYNFRKYLSNLIGWRTNRKIIIFESDDWGSIRIKSKKNWELMQKQGLNVNESNFTRFDCLESNDDLENLFTTLNLFKDKNNRPATFTPMCIMANPDFEKIRSSNFEKYYFENFTETCTKYSNHDRVLKLYKQGINGNFFVPGLHGREHINIRIWINGLKEKNKSFLNAFDNESIAVMGFNYNPDLSYLGAFYPENLDELKTYKSIIQDAGKLFEKNMGYSPTHFIAPNKENPKNLDYNFKEIGVKYLTLSKLRKYPNGDGSHAFQLNWLGKKNSYGQTIITRNCIFEPSSDAKTDWVDSCLFDIECAFKLNKPAVINTHRVNYIGTIDKSNATNSLNELSKLLKKILDKWPEVEFMTSTDLGNLITSKS